MLIFTRYDLTSEIMMYAFCWVMLLIMLITRPERSKTFRTTVMGIVFSILTITTHIHLLWITCIPEKFSEKKLYIYYLIYAVIFVCMLNMIMRYIDLLSYKKRQKFYQYRIRIAVLNGIYAVLIIFPVVTNKLYFIAENGNVYLTDWQHVIGICGLIAAMVCLITSIINAKSVSKVVLIGTLVFIPMDIIALTLQFWFDTAYFLSFTYVMPFAIFYCFFHAIKYNDIIGCQAYEAFPSMVERALRRKNNFVLIRVDFPQLTSREFSDFSGIIEDASSSICREIEKLNFFAKIYMTSDYVFTMYAAVRNRKQGEELAKKIREIIERPIEISGIRRRVLYNQVVVFNDKKIKDATGYKAMIAYLKEKMNDDKDQNYVIATEKDYAAFEIYDEAQKLVKDVRAAKRLDDERVICYIQPIYSISDGKFKSGEALMRMQNNGKMIFPDSFIPAAERNNCIHTLTLIMVNHICAKIKELEDAGYDFDGITVNSSTIELADPDFSDDIISIVEKYDIEPKHLRLEVTESTGAFDALNVKMNMRKLNEYGIMFYLDDYGTGYSNLERMATYPFKTIKFDKSILYSALENKNTDDLVKLQLDYFKKNGFLTVVEGVEDEKQYNYCKDVGFDMIQGYYFSKPQPAENITDYFTMAT